MKSGLVLFLILIFLSACSQQARQTSAKFQISTAYLISGQPGGTMLYITNKSLNQQRAIVLDSAQLNLLLDEGSYDFAVLSWAGNTTLSGNLTCARSTVSLAGPTAEVNLNLSAAACNDDYFAPAAFRMTGSEDKINPLRLIDCQSISGVTAAGNCDSGIGNSRSYRVHLLSYLPTALGKIGGLDFKNQPGMSSGCYTPPTTNPPSSVTSTGLKIPAGGTGLQPSVVIENFYDGNCTLSAGEFFYPYGLVGAEVSQLNAIAFNHNSDVKVFIESGIMTIAGNFDFGNVYIGSSSSKLFTITNFSQNDFTNMTMTIGGGGAFLFDGGSYPGSGGTCSSTLGAGSSCTVRIKFAPTTSGTSNPNLLITFMNPNSQTESRTLTGTGVALANITATPMTYDFSKRGLKTISTVDFLIQNTGDIAADPLTINFPNSNVFTLTNSTCLTTLAANGSCTLRISFQPLSAGGVSNSLSISYFNGLLPINLAPISILGSGIEILTGGGLSFPTTVVGGTSSITYTIKNNTTSPISAISPALTNGAGFSVANSCDGVTLQSGEICNFIVTFSPTGSPGTFTPTLTITYQNYGVTQSFQRALTGSSISAALLTATPDTSVDFGFLMSGLTSTRTFTIKNIGGAPATFSGQQVALLDPFLTATTPIPCSTSLGPNQTCTLSFSYTPQAPSISPETASSPVIYFDGVTTKSLTLNLSGQGTPNTFKTIPQGLAGFTDLPSNNIFDVLEKNGKIYLATQRGLAISTDGGQTFSTKTTAQGLGSNIVKGVYVDGTGNIYAATWGGGLSISTDGGNSFITRPTVYSSSSLNNQDVYVHSSGNIYVATYYGLFISTDFGATFNCKITTQGLGSNNINGVFVSDSGVIYAATGGGLSISTNGGVSFTNKTTTQGLGSSSVNGVLVDGSGVIYAATSGGLSVSTDGGTSFSNKTTANGLRSNLVQSVYIDGTGKIYAATNLGISVSTDGGASFSFLSTTQGVYSNSIRAVAVNSDGKIFAATTGGMSTSIDGGASFSVKTTVQGLGIWNVNSTFVDSAGYIYAATSGDGLSISSNGGASFINKTTLNGLGSDILNGVFVDASGKIYVASGGGLSISGNGGASFSNKTITQGLGNNGVNGVFVDSFGAIYAATGGGLSISNNGGASFVNKTTAQGLGSNTVKSVFVDSYGKIYAATLAGLSLSIDGGTSFTNKTTTQGLGSNDVRFVFVDNVGSIYAATFPTGLSISTDGGASFNKKLISFGVNGVYVDSYGYIYAATTDGLYISSNGGASFTTKRAAHGLGSNSVYHVFVDVSGKIYAATEGGIGVNLIP